MRLLAQLIIYVCITTGIAAAAHAADVKLLLDSLTAELKTQPKITYQFKLVQKVGNDMEQWSFIVNINNNTNEVQHFDAQFQTFDREGFLLDELKTVYQEDIQPGTIRTVKDFLYIDKIDRISSIKLVGDGLYNRGR